MKIPSLRNLQTLILLLMLMAILPMLGLEVKSGLSYRSQALQSSQNNALRLLNLLAVEQSQAVHAARMLLQALGEAPQMMERDGVVANDLFASMINHFPQFTNIMALSPDGRVYHSAEAGYLDKNLAADNTVLVAMRTRKLALGGYHVCPVTGKMVITFAQPIMASDGAVHSVLVLLFDLSYAYNIIQNLGLPSGSTFVMSDEKGTILYRYPDPEKWRGQPIQSPLHDIMLAQRAEEGVFRGQGLDQVHRLYAFKRFSPGYGAESIHYRIGIPESEILGWVDDLLSVNMTVALIGASIVMLLARLGCVRFVFRPVSSLISAARDIAQGELSARSNLPHTEDDLGLLSKAFDSMAIALQRREREQEQAARSIFESGERIRGMLNASWDSVILANTGGMILDLNHIAAKRRNKLPEELLDVSLFDVLPVPSAQLRKEKMEEAIFSGDTVTFEEQRGAQWYGVRIHPICDATADVVQLVSYSRDITERKRAEERLTRQAYEDELTALPNRALFIRNLESLIRSAQISPHVRFAVLFLDIDNFKLINDSFGHHAGDNLLRKFGRKLCAIAGSEVLVARFGGDEFAILIDNVVDSFEAYRLSEAIHRAFEVPEHIDGVEIYCSASIGVVLSAKEYVCSEQIMRDVDIAMYQAKFKGRGITECFTPDMREFVNERMRLEHELRSATENGELLLHYQPYYSLPEQRIIGFEALVRWQHPKRGFVSPAQFIPIAEETGLIHKIGAVVLNQALRMISVLNERLIEGPPLRMNVNLSPKQLFHGDPVALVRGALKEYKVAPELLVVEITETSLAEDIEHVADILETLRHFGVRTALDDFGTGYSSLAYLRSLPLDVLKLDRTFVEHLDCNMRDVAIAERVVALAHTLGLSVTAEGVEDADALNKLEMMRCNSVQGFYLSRPISENDVCALFHSKGLLMGDGGHRSGERVRTPQF